MKQINVFVLALVAYFIVGGQLTAQELSLVTGDPELGQPVGVSQGEPPSVEEDYGDWKLTAKSLGYGDWEQTIYAIGLGTDMAMWDEEGCSSLDVYRRGGMKGLLPEMKGFPAEEYTTREKPGFPAEEYTTREKPGPGPSMKEALKAREQILRDEVIQLRCSPNEALAPPMYLASGVDGFTLSNGFSTARIPNRVAISNTMEGYRSEVSELSLKRTDLAAADVDVMADTAAAIGPMMLMAHDPPATKPAADLGPLKANKSPYRQGSNISGKWKWQPSTASWIQDPNGATFFRVEVANVNIDASDLDSGSLCNTKAQRYVRDMGASKTGDQCGHILANRLGGNGRMSAWHNDMTVVNFFAQKGSVNGGAYRVFEGKIYNTVDASCCCTTYLVWSFTFPGTGLRPNWYDYQANYNSLSSATPNFCALKFKQAMNSQIVTKIMGFNNP